MNPELPLLIDAKKLEHSGEDVRVLDARSPLRYEAGHLPNAVNLFIVALMQARADGAQVLGPPAHIERILSAAGISATQPVVVYGEQGSQDAAYLLWALEYAGHKSVSLLDGGFEAWLRAGKKLTLAVPVVAESSFAVDPDHSRRATGEWLLRNLQDPTLALLDSRSAEEFSGQDVLARRGGHIPRARHFEWRRSLKPDLSFRHPEEIAADLEALGVRREQTLVNYCQNGIRSAHAYFAQRLAGFPSVCNYDGSWAEWGNSEKYPVESS
jgi:thiosulfate/3-mercaptopyruvate sulfurtransferase